MPDLPLALDIVIAWLVLSGIVALILLTVGSRLRRRGNLSGDRRSGEDRRRSRGDRRMGLPDLREVRIERRNGSGDRRSSERRSTPMAI